MKNLSNQKSSAVNYDLFEHGKIPPQATDVEEIVIGSMMLESNCVPEVFDLLKAECFYKESHKLIFTAISRLYSSSRPIDIITVTDNLRSMGELETVGGAYYVTMLTNRISSSVNVEYHAAIIKQKFIQRELIRIGSELIKNGYDDEIDVFDQLELAEKSVYSIAEDGINQDAEHIGSLVYTEVSEIGERKNNSKRLLGVGSGFMSLDRITNGWQKSDLVIVAARPGMGKTAFAICAARNAAMDFGVPVAIFSLEMSKSQLTQRMISAESEVDLKNLRNGSLSELETQALMVRSGDISNAPIYIDDSAAISVFDLRARARKMKRKYGIGLIVVDYLQLMRGNKDRNTNREQEISSISQGLKALAKELNVPVIALSQLSRAVESRSDKRPILSDLRESGSIEQDADLVLFLYRKAYYDDESTDDKSLEVIIAKHRNGPIDSAGLMFHGNIVKITDYVLQSNDNVF